MKPALLQKMLNTVSYKVDATLLKFQLYFRQNKSLIYTLAFLAIAAYGFELFNFNLTIDEEVHATYTAPTLDWILQGRWGMYLLNMFVFPYAIMPFVPLFVALIFHIGSILFLLNSWEIKPKLEQIVVGAICLTFPIMAYLYTFSTINYGIGIGLFFAALSLFIYRQNVKWKRLLAIIPACFSFAIYQGFIPVLIALFLILIILTVIRSGEIVMKDFVYIALIHVLALALYYIVQQLFIVVLGVIPDSSYVSSYFDLRSLYDNLGSVLTQLFRHVILPVYFGGKSIYSIYIWMLGILLFASLLSLGMKLLSSKFSLGIKTLIMVLVFSLLLLPFISGILMRGLMSPRFLIAVPIAFSGIVMLGMLSRPRSYKIFIAVITVFCVFEFIMSTNLLFASSYLALQADRSLATRLIGRIEDAQTDAGVNKINYMEIVGYYVRQPTELMPKIETFGASFFEWNQGTAFRILPFLQTLGYSGVEALPLDKRAEMVLIVDSMPSWPDKGSVLVIGDVVLVKFGPYSAAQIQAICSNEQNKITLQTQGFCK